jgi:hypothetical protein
VSVPISTTAPSGVLAAARRAPAAARSWLAGLPWEARMVVLVGMATLVARLPGLLFNGLFDRDEAYLSVMGDVMRGGGSLYVDVIDRKPPVVPLAYGLVRDLSVDMRAVRLVVAIAVLVNGVLVALLVRRLAGGERAATDRAATDRAATAAGVLAVLATSWFLPADAQAANFELWGLAPATGAVLAAIWVRGRREGAWRWFLLAGALVALAAHIKQPYIAVAAPVAWEALRGRTDRLAKLAAATVGAVLATLPMALLVDLGSLYRWAWADNGDYLDGGLSTARAFGVGVGLTVVFLCFHAPLLYGFWAAITRRVRLDPTVLVWVLASLAVVPLGLRFFGHYYQQVVPPLAVLTGVALATAPRWAWRVVGAGAVVATAVLLAVSLVHRPDLTDFTAVGRYVQSTTSSDERILVWGALPDVYVSAQREPSGVFLHDGYLTGNWASREVPLDPGVVADEPFRDRWALFLADLAAEPPEIIIDAARPGTDWAAYSPSKYPIGTLMQQCYRQVTVLDGLPVWARDHAACPTP